MSRCGPLWRRPSVKAIQQRDIGMLHPDLVTATPDKQKLSTKNEFWNFLETSH
jgi:hypothetical protein